MVNEKEKTKIENELSIKELLRLIKNSPDEQQVQILGDVFTDVKKTVAQNLLSVIKRNIGIEKRKGNLAGSETLYEIYNKLNKKLKIKEKIAD